MYISIIKQEEHIPTHDVESAEFPIQLRDIAHRNHYDFTQKHRHTYFEIILFKEGGGTQLIDFVEYEVKANTCYIVYPNQIHLLKRDAGSHGKLVQFKEESLVSIKLAKLMQERAWSGAGSVLFEEDAESFQKIDTLLSALRENIDEQSKFAKEGRGHILQALLYQLFSMVEQTAPISHLDPDFYLFQQLVDQHYKSEQTVGYYLDQLPVGEKKLSTLSKKHLGMTPLQVIHRRILLEAKRCLVFGEQSHKEIAYDLGFDSPASFSAFIKKKTGMTASEIQNQITEIHE